MRNNYDNNRLRAHRGSIACHTALSVRTSDQSRFRESLTSRHHRLAQEEKFLKIKLNDSNNDDSDSQMVYQVKINKETNQKTVGKTTFKKKQTTYGISKPVCFL